MSLIDQIRGYLAPFMPFARAIVLFFIPIYIAIGEVFAVAGLAFVGVLPIDAPLVGIVLMVVFIVLGIVLGVKYDPERRE